MKLPKPIYSLQGKHANKKPYEVISRDVPGLQIALTMLLRVGGTGFIYRLL